MGMKTSIGYLMADNIKILSISINFDKDEKDILRFSMSFRYESGFSA